MLGVFAFFYAMLHFATYMVLDYFFDFQAIVKDVIKRPYPVPLAKTAGAIAHGEKP